MTSSGVHNVDSGSDDHRCVGRALKVTDGRVVALTTLSTIAHKATFTTNEMVFGQATHKRHLVVGGTMHMMVG